MLVHTIAQPTTILIANDDRNQKNGYAIKNAPKPSLILLDLNMPRKNGFEVLKEIKAHLYLYRMPVAVLSTSVAKEDVKEAYGPGRNSYITKLPTFARLPELMGR